VRLDAITRKPTTEIFYRTATVDGQVIATAVGRVTSTPGTAGSAKMIDALWVDRDGRQVSFVDGLNLQPLGPMSQLTIRPYGVYFGRLSVGK
jgi:hypothetical protein